MAALHLGTVIGSFHTMKGALQFSQEHDAKCNPKVGRSSTQPAMGVVTDMIRTVLKIKSYGEIMTNMKQAALTYAEKGWAIFPVKRDKTPYTANGVMDATTNLEQIDEWFTTWPNANIALDVGRAEMMVLDFDPGHDMKELEDNVGPLPPTQLCGHPPRGGSHRYYRLDHGEVVAPSASKLAPHVDVRSFHSYVLLPPSVTADGSYQWSEEGQAGYRSDEMVRLANAGRAKHEGRDNWIIKPDSAANIESAISWLQQDAKVAIEGQGGDHLAFATAAHLKSFGISQEKAHELIWEHWNPRCLPPWTANGSDHLNQKIENGYAYNSSPPGNITDEYQVAANAALFKPIRTALPSGGAEEKSGRFRIIDRAGIADIKPPEWIIEDFLPEESYAILFGPPSTYKTFVALDISLSIAAGFGLSDESVWAEDIVTCGPVLFTAGEGRASISNRIYAWERTHYNGHQTPGFFLGDPVPMITEDIEPFIDAALAQSPDGFKLCVLDTVGRAMQGTNENAQENASAFTHMVSTISKTLGCAVLALHHTGLQDTDRARGSSVFGADADTIISLEQMSEDYLVAMKMKKQKDAAEWGHTRYIKLREVALDVETESLVAVKATNKDHIGFISTTQRAMDREAAVDQTEQTLLKFLSGNTGRAYKVSEIVAAVSSNLKVGEDAVRKHLVIIRTEEGRQAGDCFDPTSSPATWRWVD